MAREVSQLVVELLDRVSQPARRVSQALRGIGRTISETNARPLTVTDRLNAAISRNNRSLAAARGSMLEAAAGAYVLQRALSTPIRAAADLESAMTDVTKVVEFGSDEALARFQDQITTLSETIPMGARELTELAAQAGMAGIAADDLIPFVEMASRVGVAFGVSGEEAGNALGRMQTALGTTIPETALLADAFNHLSDNMASTAPQIMDVMLRVGATARTYGLAAQDTAALASAMIASGAESNVAATSIRNMGRALTRGSSATERQAGAFRNLGLEAEDVALRMQRDAVGTIMDVLERIQQVPEEARAALTSDLFGDEARALGPLMTNLDLVTEALGYVDDEADYAGSATREFMRVIDTFNGESQTFRNQITNIATAIGNALIPSMRRFFDTMEPILTGVREWVEANPQLAAGIVKVTSAVIGLRIAATALRYAGLLGKGGLLAGAAALLSPIGVAAAAVAAAGYAIWRYWGRLRAIWEGVSGVLRERLAPALEVLEPVLDAMSPITDRLAGAFDALGSAVDWVLGLFEGGFGQEVLSEQQLSEISARAADMTGRIMDAFTGLPGRMLAAGQEMVQSLWDGFRAKVDEFVAYLRTLPSRFAEAVRTNLSDAISLDGVPTASPWQGPPGASMEGRASGGPVTGGRTYLVGEEGPELFRSRSSGTIVPNGAIGGASVNVTVNPSFTISGGDPAEIAARVRADLEAAVREAMRSVYGDVGMRVS